MFNNKLFNMSLIILIGITLLGAIAFVLWKTTFSTEAQGETVIEDRKLTADEIVELSVETDLITTNLYNQDFVVVQFSILTDNIKAKEELEKRMMEIKATIISTLSSLTPDDLRGEEGVNRLEAMLMNRFNEILDEGKILRVYTIDRKIQ